jgi:hypothetical protein
MCGQSHPKVSYWKGGPNHREFCEYRVKVNIEALHGNYQALFKLLTSLEASPKSARMEASVSTFARIVLEK